MQFSQHFGSNSRRRPEQTVEFFDVCPAAWLSRSTSYLHFAFPSLYRSSLSLTAHTSSSYLYFSLPPDLTSSSLLCPLVVFSCLTSCFNALQPPLFYLWLDTFTQTLILLSIKERKTQFVFWAMSVMWVNREGEGETGRWTARRGGLVKVTVWWLVKCIWHKGRCLGAFAHIGRLIFFFFLLVLF